MHCQKATQLISEALDRPLSRSERIALCVHLVICSACRRFRKQVRRLNEAVRQLADEVEAAAEVTGETLSPAARQRIRAALEQSD